MALVVKDRVREVSTSTGTGTITLNGPVTGFQGFSVIGSGNTTYYTIVDAATGDWEVGIGTYTSGVNTLSRDSVLESSSAGSLVNFAAGTKDVFCTYPAEKSVDSETPQTLTNKTFGSGTTITTSNATITGGTINNTAIGGTTPAAGAFTTLSASGASVISANSSSAALRITQTGAGNALVVEDSANPDSTPFVINASGNVLVGSTNATSSLSGTTPSLQLNGENQSSATFLTSAWGSLSAQIHLTRSAGAFGNYTSLASGNQIGEIRFGGADGTQLVSAASISAAVDGTPGTNDMPGRLVFSTTAAGASSPTERMRIDNRGAVGIGSATLTTSAFRLGTSITGGTTAYGAFWGSAINPTVTAAANYHATAANTSANGGVAYTITALRHYLATQGTFHADSTVTIQTGFDVSSGLIGATNNYGFYSNIPSGTGRWNFYAAGTAANYFAGTLQIASTSDVALNVAGGAVIGTSTATTSFRNYSAANWNYSNTDLVRSAANTGNPRFLGMLLAGDSLSSTTVGAYNGIWGAYDSAPTTGSTSAALNGAMVYGAYAGHRWVTNGTERMRIDSAGNTTFGSAGTVAGQTVRISKNVTGATASYGLMNRGIVQSDVTDSYRAYHTILETAASAFTLPSASHYAATQGTIGATSAVTNQYGFIAESSLIGATNNYGFYSNIASGTGRWNFYAAGSAANFFGGQVQVKTGDQALIGFFAGGTYGIRIGANASFALLEGVDAATGSASYQPLQIGGSLLRFNTDNTERMRIFASGGVSIGNTTDPGATNLSVTGTISGGTVTGTVDGTNAIGFRTIPQNSQSAAYTLVLTDSGKQIFHPSADTTARTFTIPANASVAYPIGTAVTFINQNGAGVVTIAITTDTMRLAGAGTTGSRTLAANGIATAIKVTSTEWIISGTGLT